MKAILAVVEFGFVFWVIIVGLMFGVGALLWPYVINSWLVCQFMLSGGWEDCLV